MTNTDFWADADIISTYSRAQAIEDGELVEIPAGILKGDGVKFPAAMTYRVWAIIEDKPAYNDLTGRLHDLVWMFSLAARRSVSDQILFQAYMVSGKGRRKLHTFKAVIGPGDTPDPVITIMLPDED